MYIHQKSPKWFGAVTTLLVAASIGAGLAGCGGSNSGPQIPPTPTPGGTPSPTPTGTVFAPSPIPTARPGNVTVFLASGTFNRTTGQFNQDTNAQGTPVGVFFRVPQIAIPTPTPGPTPTASPQPTPGNSLSFSGLYTLSNGEVGIFSLEAEPPVANPGKDIEGPGTAVGFPRPAAGKTFDFDHPAETGVAILTVRVSGSTGSGRVTLSNGVTGTITIDQRTVNNMSALRSLPQNVRVRMMTKTRR